ncbi:hypothetical protein BDA96_07G193700 [Sorghum bicolor]|uniref:Uncharacterized protein n=1 Tax=Sorghum bicolor TaxID=4558 RepID=A0A921QPZ0_SORBI|nr:hypothetical protein BDA96_07G193700 [Sorghum bicolor]
MAPTRLARFTARGSLFSSPAPVLAVPALTDRPACSCQSYSPTELLLPRGYLVPRQYLFLTQPRVSRLFLTSTRHGHV